MGMSLGWTTEPGHCSAHTAEHTLVRASASALVAGCTADELYRSCLRDFGGWQVWKKDVAFELQGGAHGTEVGGLRCVIFGACCCGRSRSRGRLTRSASARGEKWLLERLDVLDDNNRTITYSGVNYGRWKTGLPSYPLSASLFPGGFVDYSSTISIREVTSAPPSAFMEWSGEVWTEPANAEAMQGFLAAFYSGNLQTLNQYFARVESR